MLSSLSRRAQASALAFCLLSLALHLRLQTLASERLGVNSVPQQMQVLLLRVVQRQKGGCRSVPKNRNTVCGVISVRYVIRLQRFQLKQHCITAVMDFIDEQGCEQNHNCC